MYYTLKPDLPIPLWTVHNVEGSMLTTIPNLLTNRTYTLKVLAYTAVGDGPLSDQVQVKMQQGGTTIRCAVSVWLALRKVKRTFGFIMCAILISKGLGLARVKERSHSF